MKLIRIILTSIFIPSLVFAQTGGEVSSDRFENIVKEANDKGVFSGNILIVKGGKIFFQESIGNADYPETIPNSPDTKFETGSITKFFTKILIHQLSEEGKLKMNENIGKYLSGFSAEVSEVTIQQLCDHTSGLGDYISREINPQISSGIQNISDVLPLIQKEKLKFKPGTKAEYSNTGYVVLANIIEKVEGRKLAEIYKEKIFDKAGMNNSGFSVRNLSAPGKAKGYLSNQLGPMQDNSEFNIFGAGDGGIYSTTGDLNIFAQSLINDNRLLTDESKLLLFNSPLFPVQYLTWDEFRLKGKFAIAGGAPGISAVLGINNEKNYVLVALSNFDQGTAEEISQRLSAVLNDREVKPFNPPPAKMIYSIIKEKGADNFVANYKTELSNAGIEIEDDMILLFAGQQFLTEKDFENAIALYSVYTKEFPQRIVGWNDMGDAYLLKDNKEEARKCFEQALLINPENKRARSSLEKLK